MALPYPTKVVLPFDIATAQDMNERHANDVALANGSGLDDGAVNPRSTSLFNYQTDNSGSIQNVLNGKLKVQMGWGQLAGSGTAVITDQVSFPQSFSTLLGVSASLVGVKAGSSASSVTDFTTTYGAGAGYSVASGLPSNSGFTMSMTRSTGTFSSSTYWGYSWIAWGLV